MAANDNAVACGNTEVTFWELLASCIGEDASGKKYIRLYATTDVADSKGFSCGSDMGVEQIQNELRSLFTVNANGDMCIRTGTAA
jgi:hypothetical protein